MLYVILILISLSILAVLLLRNNERAEPVNQIAKISGFETEDMEVVPSSVSEDRAARILPTSGSEDASHLLVRPTVDQLAFDRKDYLPEPAVDWIVDIQLQQGIIVKRSKILEAFKEHLSQDFDATLYGYSAADKHWTFLSASDVPENYSELSVGIRLVDTPSNAPRAKSQDDLNEIYNAISTAAQTLGASKILPRTSPKEAANTATRILALWNACDKDATIVLRAPDGRHYDGKQIWDVMLSLGLQWGDMDIFHWENETDAAGDSDLFGVWTNTNPGYFFPEEIAAGRVFTEDLVFGFSIPRCAAPLEVFEAMTVAVDYARKRLGGEILDPTGKALNAQEVKKQIQSIVEKLVRAGFPPGKEPTLLLF